MINQALFCSYSKTNWVSSRYYLNILMEQQLFCLICIINWCTSFYYTFLPFLDSNSLYIGMKISSALSMNVLLSFVLHDLNGTLFVKANLLSEWLFAMVTAVISLLQ